MKALFNKQTAKSDEVLRVIAHMPTASLDVLMDAEFALGLSDADLMRIAVLLAEKSYARAAARLVRSSLITPQGKSWGKVITRLSRRTIPTTTVKRALSGMRVELTLAGQPFLPA